MLNELIIEGQEIRSSISSDHVSGGVILPVITYTFSDHQKFEIWKNKCLRFLSHEFKGDRCISDFEEVIKEMTKRNYPNSLDKLIGILDACTYFPRIENNDIKEITSPTQILNITNTQQQTQTQEIAVDIFIEAIKDELTGKQLKEIKEICEKKDNSPETKSKIVDKLKSFGGDVLSNIVANIITNPSILGQL